MRYYLINDNEVKKLLISKKNLKLLWEVCQVPDFEKLFNDSYLLLLKDIYIILINICFLLYVFKQ